MSANTPLLQNAGQRDYFRVRVCALSDRVAVHAHAADATACSISGNGKLQGQFPVPTEVLCTTMHLQVSR